ncbi:MAG: hypothetical protein ACHQ50_11795 [Fimbriimonadales bacterium]
MISVLLMLALPPRTLPPHWHDLGRQVRSPGSEPFAGHYCVDESGRYVYTYQLQGVDTVTGKDRTVNVFMKTEGGKQYVRFMRGGKAPPPNWFPGSAVEVFYASGNRIGADVGSDVPGGAQYNYFGGEVVATVDGPAIAGAQAFDTVRAVCPSLIPAQHAGSGRLGDDPPHRLNVIEGNKTYRVPLPAKINSVGGVFSEVDGRSGRAYILARFGRPGAEWLAKFWEVSYKTRPPSVTSLPDPAQSGTWWREAGDPSTIARLADESICMRLHATPPRLPTGMSGKFATAILDLKTRRWKLWDKLIFFGSSLNGRYVAYGWGADPVIRIARVGP